jgi:hypothetical protein
MVPSPWFHQYSHPRIVAFGSAYEPWGLMMIGDPPLS